MTEQQSGNPDFNIDAPELEDPSGAPPNEASDDDEVGSPNDPVSDSKEPAEKKQD